MLTDKAYAANALRAVIAATGATAVIPSAAAGRHPHDFLAYKHRNCIEHCFSKLKHFSPP